MRKIGGGNCGDGNVKGRAEAALGPVFGAGFMKVISNVEVYGVLI